MNTSDPYHIKFSTILFLIFVSAAEIDICVPSFPQIRQEFNLSPFKTETLLGANLLFHCIAALFAGNLGDKYGKKRVIKAGVIIFVIGSLLCFFATGYFSLVVGRIIQGIGVAASLVLGPLIIMDLYKEKAQQQKMMSMLNGFVTLAICLAPSIGSYTTLLFSWRSIFFLLSLFGVLALGMFNVFIPNDRPVNPHATLSIKEYAIVFKSKIAILYITSLAFFVGAYYTFVGTASIIYVESFGVSLKNFGVYQGLLTFTFGVFSIFSGSIIKKAGKKTSFLSSLVCIVIFLILCLFIILFNIKDPNYITAAIFILSIGVVIPCNMLYVLGLNSISGASGKISGIFTTGKWLFTIVGIQVASYFYTYDFRSTGILMLIMELCALITLIILIKSDKNLYKEIYSTPQVQS